MTKLSNATVAANAAQGTVVGVFDADVSLQRANTPAQYFLIVGRNLVVAWAGQALPGDWGITVHGKGKPDNFTITITAAIPVPPPPPILATPKSITIAPASLSLPDSAMAGTKLADARIETSDGSAFAGKFAVDPPGPATVDPAGQLFLARSLSSADDGAHPMMISGAQNGVTVSASFSLTVTGVAAPPPPPPPPGIQPACGVTGHTLALEYVFGVNGNVKSIADLQSLFTPDAPWGRINGELETFMPFNPQNHVFETDNLALTGLADGSGIYGWGHITSGALVSKATCFAPCIVEIIAKLPAGRGVWPSLWLYDYHSGMHDASEIDIMESQFNAPIGQRDDRSMVYQNDHGPGLGANLSNPGNLDQYGRWAPYGWDQVFLSDRYAAYSVLWETDKVTKYVDNKAAITRAFRWTGPAQPNIILYDSIGSDALDWPGPVSADTFVGDNAKFRIKSIRVFKPS